MSVFGGDPNEDWKLYFNDKENEQSETEQKNVKQTKANEPQSQIMFQPGLQPPAMVQPQTNTLMTQFKDDLHQAIAKQLTKFNFFWERYE